MRLANMPTGSPRSIRLEAHYEKAAVKARPTKVEWLSSDGETIRIIRPPVIGDPSASLGDARAPIG